ncbi:unnamed protein product, partial [marine sediment metagenome]
MARQSWKSPRGWVVTPEGSGFSIYSPEGKRYNPRGQIFKSDWGIPPDVISHYLTV